MTLNDQARALYDACQTPKPSWDKIGVVNQSVWMAYVLKGVTPQDYVGVVTTPA